MSMNLSRRTVVRIISFLTAGVLALAVTVLTQRSALAYERQQNANTYLRAFDQLTSSVDKLDAALEKCVYATSPAIVSALSAQIYAEALSAQQALGELPYANLQLEQTAAFVAKTGDYASALSRSVLQNDGYSGDELDSVKALHQAAAELKERLHTLENQLYDGTATLEDVEAVTKRLSQLTEEGDVLADSSYQDIEAEFPEMPTLIYDGPFSEHLQSRTAAMLEGADSVSQEEARSLAADWLGVDAADLTGEADMNGKLPCYVFSALLEDGSSTIYVTKQGGQVLAWGNGRAVGAETMDAQQGVKAARRYLEGHGITGMEESYFIDQGSCLTVNFAATQDGVTCYPDLIKVEVALDTGSVVGYEAEGYLMNHTRRTDTVPAVTAEEAQGVVSGELEVLSCQLAIVPTDGEGEVLCWEFKCENEDGLHYIVYVNAATGAEYRLFRLVEDESGTLVL
ncbi:MAG: germination protein YpeB [Clostridiales bacterium]|nr:germination protein YpeB [Clostridiales bacterium]